MQKQQYKVRQLSDWSDELLTNTTFKAQCKNVDHTAFNYLVQYGIKVPISKALTCITALTIMNENEFIIYAEEPKDVEHGSLYM